MKIISSRTDMRVDYSVKFEPATGQIGAHESLKIAITFTPHRIPEVIEIQALLCCDIDGMDLPIGCIVKAKVMLFREL